MSDLDLPVLDVRHATGTTRAAFVRDLHEALSRWGFVAISGHGIPVALLRAAYDEARAFFALPGHEKRRWEYPEQGRQRGYTGFGVERAKDQQVHDLKEFYQIGRDLGADHPLVTSGAMPDMVWPDHRAAFREVFQALFSSMDTVAEHLLRAIAEGVGLDADELVDATVDGSTVLRVIHYPPLRPTDPPDAVRAAAHEDINLLTLLPTSTAPGLQLLDRDGTWRALVTPPDVLICDTGDLMAYLSSGALPATTHRVVNPPGERGGSRYSLPFFVHPRPDQVLRPLRGDAPPTTAGELLRQRLIANGVLAG